MNKIKPHTYIFLFATIFVPCHVQATPSGVAKTLSAGTTQKGGFIGGEVLSVASGSPIIVSTGLEYKRHSAESYTNAYFGYGVMCGGYCSFQMGTGSQGAFMRYALMFSRIGDFRLQVAYEDYRSKNKLDTWQVGVVFPLD